jgi:pimeloyl-ACP methyl ester carboxylesterase
VLYLRGRHDRVVSRASGDYIRKIHPNVEVAELDAPHLLLQTAPQAATKIVSEFLRHSIQISNSS